MFAEWAAVAVEDVQDFPLLDTGALRTVGGYTMVQHVLHSLSANFTFAGSEQAQSGAKVWLPLQGTDSQQFCLRGSERSDGSCSDST